MNSTNKAVSAPQKIYSDTYRVGLGYSVRFTYLRARCLRVDA